MEWMAQVRFYAFQCIFPSRPYHTIVQIYNHFCKIFRQDDNQDAYDTVHCFWLHIHLLFLGQWYMHQDWSHVVPEEFLLKQDTAFSRSPDALYLYLHKLLFLQTSHRPHALWKEMHKHNQESFHSLLPPDMDIFLKYFWSVFETLLRKEFHIQK